ncbi:MAG: hypothetical protein M1538_01095 [Candidatus Marsarchaeota archaeon]|jgi:hypothetical protein|nr:hypothetical protein [Candidatus Marsarchaeota archaeon]
MFRTSNKDIENTKIGESKINESKGLLRNTEKNETNNNNKLNDVNNGRKAGSSILTSFLPYILGVVGIIEGSNIINTISSIEHFTNSTAVTLIGMAYYVGLAASIFLLKYVDKKL